VGVRLLSGWWLIVAVPSLLIFAGCGGGGSSDTNELKDLRVEARDALEWPYANDAEVEVIIGGAFAIAERNAGTPLGDDAFDFAEELFFSHRWNDGAPSDSYVDTVPAPVGVEDAADFVSLRRVVGFAEAVPPPYQSAAALDAAHSFVVNHVATYLRQLERSLGSRQAWVNELQGAGSTSSTFHTEVEGAWENYGREMAYQRTVAERAGEPAGFLANCDLVLAALKLAEFEPEPASTTYDGHTFTSTYTLEAVQAGAANVEALGAAIAAAQAAFTDAR
jgi:hypothetical protein